MREIIGKKITYFLVVFTSLLCSFSLWPKAYKKFEQLSREHGLSQCTVNCMIQDRRGFLWIGTGDGLNMYDGYKFKVFSYDPANPSSIDYIGVTALSEDRDGNIWVGTFMGRLCRFDRNTETFIRYRNEESLRRHLPKRAIRAIWPSVSGVLWLGSASGLQAFDPQSGAFRSIRMNVNISVIYENEDGTLLLGGENSGLVIYNPGDGSMERFVKDPRKPGSLPDNDITGIIPAPSGGFWIGTMGGGVAHFDINEKVFTRHFRGSGNLALGGSKYVSAIVPSQVKPGILWAATFGGLVEFDMLDMRVVDMQLRETRPDSLTSNDLVSVFEDREGVLWVGTYDSGLNKFVGKKSVFQSYRHHPCDSKTIGCDIVFAILEDSSGCIWVGTEGGGIDLIDPASSIVKHFKYNQGDSAHPNSNFIRVLYEDRQGDIWVGTNGSGFSHLDRETNRFSHFVHEPDNENSLCDGFVRAILQDRAGIIWVGTSRGGLDSFDPKSGKFTHYKHREDGYSSLSSDRVQCIYEDRDGVLWVGTSRGGLNRLNREKGTFTDIWPKLTENTEAVSGSVLSILEDSRGIFWLGTHGEGLVRFDPEFESFSCSTTKEGLPNNVIYGVLEDFSGNLWLSTNCGLCRYNPISGAVQSFDRSDGLACLEFNFGAYCKGASGEMYFGGISGMTSFYPEDITTSEYVPPVQFTDLKVMNRDIHLHTSVGEMEEVVLSYKDTFLIEFSALSFASPSKNHYAYKLSELHDDWIPLGNQRVITFAQMEPGSYMLHVKGSNADGVWNEEGAAIRLVIEPPVWQTWWFKVLMVLLTITLAYSWHSTKLKNTTLKLKTESALVRLFANFKLSDREQEIANLIMKGKSNKDIEDALFISINTVKSHVYSIYRKMGVKNRLEMINLVQKSIAE
jgi:ligand-binding sensor domain-containing protein/DNA-binding CsgD family transcriptional regulator